MCQGDDRCRGHGCLAAQVPRRIDLVAANMSSLPMGVAPRLPQDLEPESMASAWLSSGVLGDFFLAPAGKLGKNS